MQRATNDGLFISIGGFNTGVCIDNGSKNKLLLLTGMELRYLINKKISLWELLDYKLDGWPRANILSDKSIRQATKRWRKLLSHFKHVATEEITILKSKYHQSLYVHRTIESKILTS
jgi:hypothetical protein